MNDRTETETRIIKTRFMTYTRRVSFAAGRQTPKVRNTPTLKKIAAALVAPVAVTGLMALALLQMGSTAPGSQDFSRTTPQIGPWQGPQVSLEELSYLPPEISGRDSIVA